MKFFFTTCALLPMAMGFGTTGVEGDNACEQCICAIDLGEIDDPSNAKCCAARGATGDEWDGFCDAVALIECSDVCADTDGHALTELMPHLAHHSSQEKAGHSGDICGRHTFEGNDHDDNDDTPAGCGEGLFCVKTSPDSDIRVCATWHGALANLADEDEEGKLLMDMTPGDHSLDHAWGIAHDEPLTDERRAEIRANLIDRLGLTEIQANLMTLKASDNPTRRQWGQPNYYTQPTYHGSSSSGSCTAGCACNAGTANANGVVKQLEGLGVEAICWDYDLTANTLHTYQKSYGDYSDITEAMSKHFIAVAEEWCKQKPNTQAICTYSNAQAYNYIGGKRVPGTTQIKEALKRTLSSSCYKQFANRIYGKNNSGNRNQPGKSWHLQQFSNAMGGRVPKSKIMLVDDTADNINVALAKNSNGGYQTLFVTPNKGYCSSSARANVQATKSSGSW